MIDFDTHELVGLSRDLGNLGRRATNAMVDVYQLSGDHLAKAWAARARTTSGVHGKHYPDSIDSEMLLSTDIAIEVGPNPSKPQGGMSFEFGSSRQPPHLDGQFATDEELPLLDRRINAALARLGL